MNLPFELTLGGAVVLGLIVIVGFSAWNTGNNLLFLVLSFLTGRARRRLFRRRRVSKARRQDAFFPKRSSPASRRRSSSACTTASGFSRPFPWSPKCAGATAKKRARRAQRTSARQMGGAADAPADHQTHARLFRVRAAPRRDRKQGGTRFPRRGRIRHQGFRAFDQISVRLFRHRRRLSAQEAGSRSFRGSFRSKKISKTCLWRSQARRQQTQDGTGSARPRITSRWTICGASTGKRRRARGSRSSTNFPPKTISASRFSSIRASEKSRTTKKKTIRERLEANAAASYLSPSEERFEAGASKAASFLSYFTEEQAEIRLVIDGEKGEFCKPSNT